MTKLSELPEYHTIPAISLLGMKTSPFEESIFHAAAKFNIGLEELIVSGGFDGSWRAYRGWMQFRGYKVHFEIPFDRFEDYGHRIVDDVIHNVVAQLSEAVYGKEIDRICENIKVRALPGKVRVIRMKGRKHDNTFGVEAGRIPSSPLLRSREDTVEWRKLENNTK